MPVFGASAIMRRSPYSIRSSTHTSAASQSSSAAITSETPCLSWFAKSLEDDLSGSEFGDFVR